MRSFWVGLVTVLLLVSCSSEVTTTGIQTEANFQTETIVETDPPGEATDVADVDETDGAVADGEIDGDATTADATVEPVEEPVQQDEPVVGDGLFPTVVDAVARTSDDTTWRFDVTLLSEYDSPARYADAWRVLDPDDNELGIRVLAHDHANEQPFTRSTTIEIPAEITTVFIEGRDQVNGWSGERFELMLTR